MIQKKQDSISGRMHGETLDIAFRTVISDSMENPNGALVAWGDPVIRASAEEDYKNVI